MELWSTPSGARGATAHTLAVDGEGATPFTITLARAEGQDPFFDPRQAAAHEPVWGSTLDALSRGGFALEGAQAATDRRLSPGRTAHRRATDLDLAALLARRPELFVSDWPAILDRVAAAAPSLRADARPIPLLLRPTIVDPGHYDALRQHLVLPVRDAAGRWLALVLEGDDRRLDAVAAMQARGVPAALVVLARRDSAAVVLAPIAALQDGTLRSFDTEPLPPEARRHPGVADPPAEAVDGRAGWGDAARFAPTEAADAASRALLARIADEALALAELGGRMEDAERLARLGCLAGELDAAGLTPLAALLRRLARASAAERPARLLAYVHAAACHAALVPHLPLLHRCG